LSIDADTSITTNYKLQITHYYYNILQQIVRLPVATVNTVATHACSFKPVPYFCAYTPNTYITCTHLYPAQNRIFSTKKICTARYRYRV